MEGILPHASVNKMGRALKKLICDKTLVYFVLFDALQECDMQRLFQLSVHNIRLIPQRALHVQQLQNRRIIKYLYSF